MLADILLTKTLSHDNCNLEPRLYVPYYLSRVSWNIVVANIEKKSRDFQKVGNGKICCFKICSRVS